MNADEFGTGAELNPNPAPWSADNAVELEPNYYQHLFEFAPEAYFITDREGKIQIANQATARLFNTELTSLAGRSLADFIVQPHWRTLHSELLRLPLEAERIELLVRLRPVQQRPFDAAISLTVAPPLAQRHSHGQPQNSAGWRWTLRDLSLPRPAANLICKLQHQNLQLVEAAQIKSNFLGMMSHELRTPLQAIIGFSQLLLGRWRSGLTAQQISLLERILCNGQHLLELINDVLDFVKLEAGRLELKPVGFDLVILLEETVANFRPLAEEKNLELVLSIAISNPRIVNDRDRLQQILVNLLSNAIKFTPRGRIQVQVWEVSDQELAIAVTDTGIGIAAADLPHIFESFRQVNQSLTRIQGGTGLGLAIVDALLHLMGGQISVESNVGSGSTFCIRLPRRVAA